MKLLKLLDNYELTGNSLLIEDLEEDTELKTDSGIIITSKPEGQVALKKAKVLKAGPGYMSEHGKWIENRIAEGAEIYYKNAGKYELGGIIFLGTEPGQVVAYKNPTNELGQKHNGRYLDE
jgi:co-chaperonin GroES (HSP10)